jgi:protein phosphatase
MTQYRWTSASRSHVGLVRRVNEDACLDQPERGLWGVADGMGGHAIGDHASRTVIETLGSIPPQSSLPDLLAGARERLQSANRQLRAEAERRNLQTIGSTVVVLLACEGACGYLWAGDSRIYLFRNARLTRLSRDHSHLEALKARGQVTAEDSANHPSQNMITRAVGAEDALVLDEGRIDIQDGDMFLLCSDGLSNEVSEQEIAGALVPGNCRQAAEALVDLALERGGHDNISAVVVGVEDLYSSEKTMFNPAL